MRQPLVLWLIVLAIWCGSLSPALSAECERDAPNGLLIAPSDGKLTARFGPFLDPMFGTHRLHEGWDYDDTAGAPVFSAARGVVTSVGRYKHLGLRITIAHGDGLETTYAHLSQIDVEVGACLEMRSKIGSTGSTGMSDRPHLHFEITRHGQHLDPAHFLPIPHAD